VFFLGAGGEVTQIENGALNQTLCAIIAEYEGDTAVGDAIESGEA